MSRAAAFHTRSLLLLIALASCGGDDATAHGADGATEAPALRNVDVTIVYPLPALGDLDRLLRPADPANGGALLPASIFAGGHVPEVDEISPLESDEARLAALRVVAIRFDPCPGVVAPPPPDATCKPDIRLVFQSLRAEGESVQARDGAIHAFYELGDAAFRETVAELRAIRKDAGAVPEVRLGVHPRLAAEGPSGAFAKRIRALVLKQAGAVNVVRVTNFRRRSQSQSTWTFGLREKKPNGWQDSRVPTTPTLEQGLTTISGGRWDADITPLVTHLDDVTHLFEVSTPAEERAAFGATVRVLNPRIHTSESVDCATCHIAPDVDVFARATKGLTSETHPQRFVSTYPLAAATQSEEEAIGFGSIHMLSYLGTSLSVTTRAANETAAVLERINAQP
jgi:hypothetical protein